MTLHNRLARLETRRPARTVTGARDRLAARLDAIAARLPMTGAPSKATAADLKAELATILQRPKP